MPWDRLWDAFFSMPGIHPAFFVLVLWVAWLAIKELRSSEKARLEEYKSCAAAADVAADKQNSQQRDALQILDRNAVNMAARTAALDSTVLATQEQAKGFERLVMATELRARGEDERFKQLEKQLENIARAVSEKK